MTDPIADMLTRIRNGYQAKIGVVKLPHSKINQSIAKIMVKKGYLKKAEVDKKNKFKTLALTLKYVNKKPVVNGIKRVSKPGLRIYCQSKKLKRPDLGIGINIISTASGLMTGKEAKKKNLGGEIICEIW